jgi:ribosomal protein L11 methyltransferase
MPAYLSLRCRAPLRLEDELPELFSGIPVLGTEIGVASGDMVDLAVYFASCDADARRRVCELLADRGAAGFVSEFVPAEDWLAAYREQVRAFAVGRGWWIDPHPTAPTPAPVGRSRLVMPPRMAFGSGSHESTRLALQALEEIELAVDAVLDVGTGSGILAIAVERAGAGEVIALDNDPTAVWVAREIALLQDLPVGVQLVVGSLDCVAGRSFDVILCNMITEQFVPLIGAMERLLSPAGLLVLSGLMAREAAEVERALARASLHVRARLSAGEWASLTAERRP